MARKIELRRIDYTDAATGTTTEFVYADVLLAILRSSANGQGLTLDEITESLAAMSPIEAAVADNKEHVILSDKQWNTLVQKLIPFRFGFAHTIISDFGTCIRNAAEITSSSSSTSGASA